MSHKRDKEEFDYWLFFICWLIAVLGIGALFFVVYLCKLLWGMV